MNNLLSVAEKKSKKHVKINFLTYFKAKPKKIMECIIDVIIALVLLASFISYMSKMSKYKLSSSTLFMSFLFVVTYLIPSILSFKQFLKNYKNTKQAVQNFNDISINKIEFKSISFYLMLIFTIFLLIFQIWCAHLLLPTTGTQKATTSNVQKSTTNTTQITTQLKQDTYTKSTQKPNPGIYKTPTPSSLSQKENERMEARFSVPELFTKAKAAYENMESKRSEFKFAKDKCKIHEHDAKKQRFSTYLNILDRDAQIKKDNETLIEANKAFNKADSEFKIVDAKLKNAIQIASIISPIRPIEIDYSKDNLNHVFEDGYKNNLNNTKYINAKTKILRFLRRVLIFFNTYLFTKV